MKTSTIFLLGVVFIIISVSVFIVRSSQSEKEHNPVPEEAIVQVSVTPDLPTDDEVKKALKEKIEFALNNRTPALLLDSMTEKVTVTRYGTTCCGTMTKQQVSPQFAYIQNAQTPWTVEEGSVAATLREEDPEAFEDSIIATSANGYIFAVRLTPTDLLEHILMATPF